jgi:hypothetical protein
MHLIIYRKVGFGRSVWKLYSISRLLWPPALVAFFVIQGFAAEHPIHIGKRRYSVFAIVALSLNVLLFYSCLLLGLFDMQGPLTPETNQPPMIVT